MRNNYRGDLPTEFPEDSDREEQLLGMNSDEYPPKRKKHSIEEALFVMTFDVCNRTVDQRVALVHGIAIGSAMNATVVLPDLLDTHGDDEIQRRIPFSRVYNQELLSSRLKDVVRIADSRTYVKNFVNLDTVQMQQEAYKARASHGYWNDLGVALRENRTQIVRFGCTFGALNALGDSDAVELLWTINHAIDLSAPLQRITDLLLKKVRDQSPTGRFTALYVPDDDEWEDDCAAYIEEGDECDKSEDKIDTVLTIERVPSSEPIYIAGDSSLKDTTLEQLNSTYFVMMKKDWFADFSEKFPILKQRDLVALIDFAICEDADLVVSNSFSPSGALVELRRRKENLQYPYALHYNIGRIPLARYMPINPMNLLEGDYPQHVGGKPLKWVFTLGEGANETIVQRMKVAVLSAINNTNLLPYCLYYPQDDSDGDQKSKDEVEQWLLDRGVIVIHHRPKWVSQVRQAVQNTSNPQYWERVLTVSFMEIEIPVVGFVDNYILYTDKNVAFLRDPTWKDFGTPLPDMLVIGADPADEYNRTEADGGIALLNNHHMRRTYNAFVDWIFTEEHINNFLEFGGRHGTGAVKEFYESTLSLATKPPFSWKVNWAATEEESRNIAIVHLPRLPTEPTGYPADLTMNMLQDCRPGARMCKHLTHRWKSIADCVTPKTPCAPMPREILLKASANRKSDTELPNATKYEPPPVRFRPRMWS